MIVLAVSLFLLVLEELLHRLNRGPSFIEFDLDGDDKDQIAEQKPWRITRFLSWLRIWQLLVFGVLFAIIAASSGMKVLSTTPGQIAALVLLIQVARIVNRKVIRQWAVLGGVVVLQVILLIVLGLKGLDAGGALESQVHQMDWFISVLSFLVTFLISLSIPFTGTFLLRLASREGSGFYYSQPPLAYSEYWVRRIASKAARMNLFFLLFHIFLIIKAGYPAGPLLLQIGLGLFLYLALLDFRKTTRLYHSLGVALISAAWSFNILWLVADLNTVSRGWFV